jgi:TfoX/Sxy family transcriptional regulator of competence genes
MAYDENTAGRVREWLSNCPDVTEQKMMGGLCFLVKGHMCCSVSGKGGLLVRVGAEAHQSMLGEPHVRLMGMGGRTMTGFVRVAPEGHRTDTQLKKWIKRGLDFVATMPPRSSARTKTKAAKQQPTKPRARASQG